MQRLEDVSRFNESGLGCEGGAELGAKGVQKNSQSTPCMCVYIFKCVYIYLSICVCVCERERGCVCVCVCVCVCGLFASRLKHLNSYVSNSDLLGQSSAAAAL